MNRKMKQEKLAKQISLALMAGMVTYTPVAFGMPVQDGTAAGVTVTRPNDVTMNITGDNPTNVINWVDFSIAKDEFVNFTNTNNYANIVTGSATSFIDGHMNGGGDIYLINPNGVIFGKDAQVNVGNLYVSTQGGLQDKSYADVASAVASPVTTVASDVVNLGTIQANKVEVVGNNIRFLNAAQIQTKDGSAALAGTSVKVTASADGYIHVGHDGGMPTSDYNVSRGTLTDYQLVHNLSDLRAINDDETTRSRNYMLADDINKDGDVENFTPIANFSGNFDGMFYTVNNLDISDGTGGNGVFAYNSGDEQRIENVGLVNVNVINSGETPAGGILGSANATHTYLKNVYSTGGSVSGGDKDYNGGLVGKAVGTLTVESSYNDSSVYGGGILGAYLGLVEIRDVYNTGTITTDDPKAGLVSYPDLDGDPVLNAWRAYTTSGIIEPPDNEDGKNTIFDTASADFNTDKSKKKSYYSTWGSNVTDTGGVSVDSSGNVTKSAWRIYEGQTKPLLTAFFKGTVQADYTYSMGSSVSDYSNMTSNGTLGISSDKGDVVAVYNGGTVHTSVDALKNLTDEEKALISYAGDKRNAERKQSDTAPNYALFYSTQQGYDIAGSNFTITKRKVQSVGGDASLEVSREYQKNAVYDASGTTTGTLAAARYGLDGKLMGDTGVVKEDQDTVGMSGVSETFYSLEKIGKTTLEDCDNWFDNASETEKEAAQDGTVGRNKYVRLTYGSGAALSGDGSENYELVSGGGSANSSINGVITPKTLTLTKKSGITDITKVYDGTTYLADTYKSLDNVFTLDTTGVVSGDNVALSGTAPTAYGGSDAGAYDVDYTALKLNNDNYRISYDSDIIYCGNDDFAVNKANGATVTLDGKITPREIDVTTAFNTVTKTYDGTASADGVTLTAKDPSEYTGVISADKDKIVFTLGTGAKFKNDAGTEDASTVAIARKVAGDVTVSLKPGAGNVLKNYKFSGNTDEQTLDVINTAAFNSEGNITRRNLDIILGTTTGIDKEYDGNNVVADTYKTFGGNYAKYADGSAQLTGNDGVTISVAAVYDSYDTTKDADGSNVHRDSERNVLNKNITYTVSLDGAEKDNYTINSADVSVSKTSDDITGATGKINPVEVTTDLSGVTLEHTYNGKSSATAAEISSQITGSTVPIKRSDTGDVISGLSLDTTNMGAVYYTDSTRTTKATHAGTGYTVQYSDLALSGTGNVADNYDFSTSDVVTSSGTIKAKTINSLGEITQDWNAVTKEYDGTTDVYWTDAQGNKIKEDSSLSKSNILTLYNVNDKDDSGEQVYIAFRIAEAAYANKNVDGGAGTSSTPANQKITYKVTLTGDSANDYDLSGIPSTSYDPTTKQLKVEKDAWGIITPKAVSLSGTPDGLDKVYDGNANAAEAVTILNQKIDSGEITLVGVVSGDTVALSGATSASYASKNVDGGTGMSSTEAVQNVTFSGVGLDSGNYVLSNGTVQGTGTIHKRELKVLAADGISKQYDGSSVAGRGFQITDVMAPYVTLKNGDTVIHDGEAIVSGETFDVNKIDANYGKINQGTFTADANAGADKVKYASISSTIANANNYTLLDANGNALTDDSVIAGGSITKRAINATDIKFDLEDSITKTYDGTDLVTNPESHIVGNAPYVEIENGEHLNVSDYTIGEAKFGYEATDGFHASKNVANVNKAAYELSFGEHALDNFDVTGTVENLKAMTTGSITPRALVLSAAADTKIYDGTTASNGVVTADNLANGDTLTATQVFDNANVQPAVHVISVVSTGTDKYIIRDANNADMTSNYAVTTQTEAGTIDPAKIRIQFKDVSKEYDGTVAVTDPNRGLDFDTTGTISEQVAAIHEGDVVKLIAPDYSVEANAYYLLGADVKANVGKTDNVIYKGLILAGAQSGNYILANVNGTPLAGDATNGYTAYGNGTIAQKVLSGDLNIEFDNITKTYNNDYDVLPDSTHSTIDKYITSAKAGTADLVYSVAGAAYKQKDAGNNLNVDFTLQVNTDNYDISGLSGVTPDGKFTATAEGKGIINKKTVTAEMKGGSYSKTYDGTTVLKDNGTVVTPEALRAIVTVTGLYDDGSDVTVSGEYAEKDAGERTINYLIASNDALKKNYILTGKDSSYVVYGNDLKVDRTGTISKATMSATDATAAIRAFDGTTKAYNDAAHGGQEISLTLTGVNGESLVINNGDIDVDKRFSGDYGTHDSTADNFTPDSHVYYKNDQPAYKSVKYSGITAAADWVAEHGTEAQKGILKNYNITDTAYFSEAQEKGKIVPLAVTADAVKSKWNAVTKVYDGTNVVKESDTAGLQLYMEVGDKEVPITYTTSSAVYDNNQVDVGENLGVTYTLAGIIGQYSGDYSMSDAEKQSFVNKQYKSVDDASTPGSITKRTVYVDTPYAEKTYDASENVNSPSASLISTWDPVNNTGVYEGDKDYVSFDTTGLTGQYSRADVYDASGNKEQEVTYKGVSLAGTKAGNYKLVKKADDGTETEISSVTTEFKGKGVINPLEVDVDFLNPVKKEYDGTTDVISAATVEGAPYDNSARNIVAASVTGGTLERVNNDDGSVTLKYKPTAGDPILAEVTVQNKAGNSKYDERDAGTGLGVDYYLEWNNSNFSLMRKKAGGTSEALKDVTYHAAESYVMSGILRGDNNGVITQKEITMTAPRTAEKDYDGTTSVPSALENLEFVGLVANDMINGKPKADRVTVKGTYDNPDALDEHGEIIDHTVTYELVGIANRNYKLTNAPVEGKGIINKSKDPLDPSNPDSPFNPDNPMYPSKPGSPLNPNSGVGQAIAQASKFKPDDKSYNRASHDDNIEHFGQQSAISIQYEDAGVNVGDEEAVVGKRSLIGIESAGNVVNLGDAEMRAGNIGIENNGTNLGSAAEQAAIEAGLPATESYEAVPVVATAEQEDAVVESPFLSRLRQGQSAASDESEGEVSAGISIITAEPEDEDEEEEEKKNRAALMARSDRETHIGIETIGGGVNMAATVR